ncbi:MAG: P-loop NTPase fold protein [Rhodobacterales bacterium]|nr:P-loop NTPase fold protein [Rhodobacterales bacterium]
MGLKLIVPEVEIDLYKDGFDGKDLLGRAETGKRLSQLVEKIDDPMVVALDGAWGSGKSHFLKMWVGAHTKEFEGTAKTVYFDAFKNDYLDAG